MTAALAPARPIRTPRIAGYLLGFSFIYGVWRIAPEWITGAIGLLVLYGLVTYPDRVTLLIAGADQSLRGLIAPVPTGAGGGGRAGREKL